MWGFFTEMGFNGKIGFWQENGGRYNIFGFFVPTPRKNGAALAKKPLSEIEIGNDSSLKKGSL